jgi:ABC-type ATPase involved in cell division
MALMIQVSELHYTDSDGLKILDDVHLRLDREEMAFLIGSTRTGKSILLNILATMIPPQSGQILVHGRNIARLSKSKILELRRRIGFLPQDFMPLSKTVLDNVMFKLRSLGDFREKAEEKGLIALEKVGLTAKLTTPAAELAPLEQIQLGLALTICNEPLILLLDEPFDSLDTADRNGIFETLEEIHAEGATILIATQGPLPQHKEVYRTLRLVDGKVLN